MGTANKFRLFPERYGFLPYVFLLYLLMPAYYIAEESGWKMVAGYGMLFLFFMSYRQLYCNLENNVSIGWLVIQVLIILIFSIFYNLNSLFMGFFTAHFIGWFKSKRAFWTALILFSISIFTTLFALFDEFPSGAYYLLIMMIVMLCSPFGIRSMNTKVELEEKLNVANERIESLVKREERMRISRDLHDTLGHTLSLITLKSQLVVKMVDKDTGGARREAKEIERTSRIALKQVRELVSDMRALTISEVLFESQAILEAAGIKARINISHELEEIPSMTQNILGMCVREGVTNVVKHSQATMCSILCEKHEGEVFIRIKDNGKGMSNEIERGNGICGMSERLELIEGNLSVQTDSHKGFILEMKVPVIIKEGRKGVS